MSAIIMIIILTIMIMMRECERTRGERARAHCFASKSATVPLCTKWSAWSICFSLLLNLDSVIALKGPTLPPPRLPVE